MARRAGYRRLLGPFAFSNQNQNEYFVLPGRNSAHNSQKEQKIKYGEKNPTLKSCKTNAKKKISHSLSLFFLDNEAKKAGGGGGGFGSTNNFFANPVRIAAAP